MDLHKLESLADLFWCLVGRLPSSYHGLPLCVGKPSQSLWNPVIERFEKKLFVWKCKHLFRWEGNVN